MPTCTTKRRTTTNLKTKNNQNCQKIKLFGSPTTKELKEKHSSRPIGGADSQPVWRGLAARQQMADQVVPHSHADTLGQLGRETDHTT